MCYLCGLWCGRPNGGGEEYHICASDGSIRSILQQQKRRQRWSTLLGGSGTTFRSWMLLMSGGHIPQRDGCNALLCVRNGQICQRDRGDGVPRMCSGSCNGGDVVLCLPGGQIFHQRGLVCAMPAQRSVAGGKCVYRLRVQARLHRRSCDEYHVYWQLSVRTVRRSCFWHLL